MTSLYQALKSAARVVSALVSAMHPSLNQVNQLALRHCFLRAAPEIPKDHLAPTPFIRADHDGKARLPGIGQLQLLSHRLRAQGIFHAQRPIAQAMSEVEHVRDVLFGDEHQKDVDAGSFDRSQTPVLQQFSQNDVSHPESERWEVHASKFAKQVVVPSTATDSAESPAGVEQLEDHAGVVGQASDNREINFHERAEAHVAERLVGLPKRLSRPG